MSLFSIVENYLMAVFLSSVIYRIKAQQNRQQTSLTFKRGEGGEVIWTLKGGLRTQESTDCLVAQGV